MPLHQATSSSARLENCRRTLSALSCALRFSFTLSRFSSSVLPNSASTLMMECSPSRSSADSMVLSGLVSTIASSDSPVLPSRN